jgi:hypothetical protein
MKSPYYQDGIRLNQLELKKTPSRTEFINYLFSKRKGPTRYLEIGMRNPDDNFNHILADEKFSVDPGVEFLENPASFKVTSDVFFQDLSTGKILNGKAEFDIVFIDGLHTAEQADRDIAHALSYLKKGGFVVIHDCNPPTAWHVREIYEFHYSPAEGYWNGSTWKAFLKWRTNPSVFSCCIDSDWGIGVLSKDQPIGTPLQPIQSFFDYTELDAHRKEYLNLLKFDEFRKIF